MSRLASLVLAVLLLSIQSVASQEVAIESGKIASKFNVNGVEFVISRNQNPDNVIKGNFAKTSRACPPFCIHPLIAAPGVKTLGEIELLEFLEQTVAQQKGFLIDTRSPAEFRAGSIPGAVNIPFATLTATNPFRNEILVALGATKKGKKWDYSKAVDLALYCNGPWCDQSPQAIRNLIVAGYPVSKLKYYRGGMQLWNILGLTINKS